MPDPSAPVLLDLTFLPSRSGITELWLKDEVVRHSEKANVDLPLLAASYTIHRCAHIIINPAFRHAAENPECMPVGVEQHLVGLQGIGP